MCRLMLVLLFVILEFIYAIVGQGCKISAISGAKDYKNDKFPSVARVTRNSNQNFICNAAIISKKQLVTGELLILSVKTPKVNGELLKKLLILSIAINSTELSTRDPIGRHFNPLEGIQSAS